MFVIDVLGECNGENDIQLILRLLSQVKNLYSVRLRVLVTSRPETRSALVSAIYPMIAIVITPFMKYPDH